MTTTSKRVTTGLPVLDRIIGGGVPCGKLTELLGPRKVLPAIGMTAIREVQKLGGVCAFIDVSRTFDVEQAKRLGVELADLLVAQPETVEGAFEVVSTLTRTGAIDLIVVDAGETIRGRTASRQVRALCATLEGRTTAILFLSKQEDRGALTSPDLKFYGSVRIHVEPLMSSPTPGHVGAHYLAIAKVLKNKLATAPFQEAMLDLIDSDG